MAMFVLFHSEIGHHGKQEVCSRNDHIDVFYWKAEDYWVFLQLCSVVFALGKLPLSQTLEEEKICPHAADTTVFYSIVGTALSSKHGVTTGTAHTPSVFWRSYSWSTLGQSAQPIFKIKVAHWPWLRDSFTIKLREFWMNAKQVFNGKLHIPSRPLLWINNGKNMWRRRKKDLYWWRTGLKKTKQALQNNPQGK